MSEIGDDLVDVFEELGSLVQIYQYSTGETVEEYVDPASNMNPVYPWTTHHVISASFGYNTVASPGDLVTFEEEESAKYLIVALMKERFESEVISKEGILYLCNKIVRVQRLSTSRNNYDLVPLWPIVYSGEVCLYTGVLKEREIQNKDYGRFTFNKEDQVFLSDYLDIRVGDRLWIYDTMENIEASGECKEVLNVENKQFPGIKICLLSEDNR